VEKPAVALGFGIGPVEDQRRICPCAAVVERRRGKHPRDRAEPARRGGQFSAHRGFFMRGVLLLASRSRQGLHLVAENGVKQCVGFPFTKLDERVCPADRPAKGNLRQISLPLRARTQCQNFRALRDEPAIKMAVECERRPSNRGLQMAENPEQGLDGLQCVDPPWCGVAATGINATRVDREVPGDAVFRGGVGALSFIRIQGRLALNTFACKPGSR